MLEERKTEPDQRKDCASLEEIKHRRLIATERSQPQRGADRSEERKTAWRRDRSSQNADWADAVESAESVFHSAICTHKSTL